MSLGVSGGGIEPLGIVVGREGCEASGSTPTVVRLLIAVSWPSLRSRCRRAYADRRSSAVENVTEAGGDGRPGVSLTGQVADPAGETGVRRRAEDAAEEPRPGRGDDDTEGAQQVAIASDRERRTAGHHRNEGRGAGDGRELLERRRPVRCVTGDMLPPDLHDSSSEVPPAGPERAIASTAPPATTPSSRTVSRACPCHAFPPLIPGPPTRRPPRPSPAPLPGAPG